MNKPNQTKNHKILIVDDSPMNRAILSDMLEDRYEILEAENGIAAVELLDRWSSEISLVLLDIVMPEMDGLEVLAMMNRYHWIEEIPVIMISAENSNSVVERAYELGAADYISRPFDEVIVCRRVINTIMLYSKQKKLVSMVADQMYESEKSNTLMVSILSHIVEFRNGESGLHVLHIGTMTEMLLKRLAEKTNRYQLDSGKISMITKAAAFHDIGKISISEEILNKPGRLTQEEFAIMKTHSAVGAEMLANLPLHKDEPLVKVAYEICRWHHERYDGSGYPDGLKGDQIPISAQVVSLADAYDALTSQRVYKPAYSHEKAMTMILGGECGVFHPLLLECLQDISDRIQEELTINSLSQVSGKEMRHIVDRLLSHQELANSNRTLSMLEEERIKTQFFSSTVAEIQFEYTVMPSMLTLSNWGANRLGLPKTLLNPLENRELLSILSREELLRIAASLRATTPDCPIVELPVELMINNQLRHSRILCQALWSCGENRKYTGAIGKILDVHRQQEELTRLKKQVSQDPLTDLLKAGYAKRTVSSILQGDPDRQYAMVLIQMDFTQVSGSPSGQLFTDHVMKYLADCLSRQAQAGDVAARLPGERFLLFTPLEEGFDRRMDRLMEAMSVEFDDFCPGVILGVAQTKPGASRDYKRLYHRCEMALSQARRKDNPGPGQEE